MIWSRISAGRCGLLPIELPLKVYALLFANLQQADLLSPTRHAIPGPASRGIYPLRAHGAWQRSGLFYP
ncbi:hypothetical protein CKO42_19025 [Lamprobacter modestohalophilus]|uniref:Uncharacterized protein n=1 Tax=Lamprobacter modestohalophilus TaxID=1064514 RepID=A0A9X1B5I0_9GAMM|nr:hypothetical protein [Lamprobacter modestohalophilus]